MVTVEELNQLEYEQFVERLRFLFEGTDWVLREAWTRRPFRDAAALYQALVVTLQAGTLAQKRALIAAHPELAGEAVFRGAVTLQSAREQEHAGLTRLNEQELATFRRLNRLYREKFGFPFVICVRDYRKEEILEQLHLRLEREVDQEVQEAVAQIARIVWYRLYDALGHSDRLALAHANRGRAVSVVGEGVRMDQMPELAWSYGKIGIPVYLFAASPLEGLQPIPESPFTGRPNTVFAYEVEMQVYGQAFRRSYTDGDNSMVIATDSMKNFVLQKSVEFTGATPEEYLVWLGSEFLGTYAHVERIRLHARALPFEPVQVPTDGSFAPSPIAFRRQHGERSWVTVVLARQNAAQVVTELHAGLAGLELMKVTGSAFSGYIRDQYTTLPETDDRPLYIALDVAWRYQHLNQALDPTHASYVAPEQVRDLLQVVFHATYDRSIQELLFRMGSRLLDRFPQLAEVAFVAQNRTRQLVIARPPRAVYTDPFPAYGRIELVLRRSKEES